MRITDPTHLPSTGCDAYAGGFRVSILVFRLVALLAAIILLQVQAIPFDTPAARIGSAPGFPAEAAVKLPGDYGCTTKRVRTSKKNQGVLRETIREAIQILEGCPACRQYLRGKDPRGRDPVQYLSELGDKRKIVLTKGIPEAFRRDRVTGLWTPMGYEKFDKNKKMLALSAEPILPKPVLPEPSEAFLRPCIYLNAASFAGEDESPIVEPYDGLTLPQARGILLLHEFGHVNAAIPSDWQDPTGWTSSENGRCVKRVCEPCAADGTRCEHGPMPAELKTQSSEPKKPQVKRR